VSNWWQIHLDQSYFAQAGRPPLLQHLWSLAIEEQFYLLFPPLFVLAVARFAHRNVRWFLIACSVASAVYMAILFTPFEDPSGAYYNTFARASGLLLGAVLAMVWAPWRERRRTGPGAVAAMNVTGVLGLALIVWFLTRVNAFDSFIYRGGFFLLDLVCVAVIAVLVHPSAWLGRVLGVPPLVGRPPSGSGRASRVRAATGRGDRGDRAVAHGADRLGAAAGGERPGPRRTRPGGDRPGR
jgi:peptidoglycan/LPS O-acetylase OafA/YrhL